MNGNFLAVVALQALLALLAGFFGYIALSSRKGSVGLTFQDGRARLVIATIGVLFCSMGFVVLAISAQPLLRKAEVVIASPVSAEGVDPIAWVQFRLGSSSGDANGVSARAIIGASESCPDIAVGGGLRQKMVRRIDPRSQLFGNLCELVLPLDDTKRIEITYGGKSILSQTLTPLPQAVAVLGDTGCRMVQYADQGCNDASTWPFAKLAAAAASKDPQLVLHVGDYLYREQPCQREELPANCNPSAHGDNERAWRKDFFDPARTLLAKAPWIFGRGNHEDCARAGYGWFYYFGESDKPVCQLAHATSYVSLKALTFINLDTAHSGDKYADGEPEREWDLATQKIIAGKLAIDGPVFLVTHRPLYAVCDNFIPSSATPFNYECKKAEGVELEKVRQVHLNLRNAASGRPVVVFGGDIHTFQVFDVPPGGDVGRPTLAVTQVVVGNGGTSRDDYSAIPSLAPIVFEQRVAGSSYKGTARVWQSFGFGIVNVISGRTPSIELTMHDANGTPKFTCTLGAGLTATTGC